MADWPHAMTKRLSALIDDGYSSSQVMRILNDEFKARLTRNSVVGRAARCGFKFLGSSGIGAKSRKDRDNTPKPVAKRRSPLAYKRPVTKQTGAPELARAKRIVSKIAPTSAPVAFLDRTRHQCAWPVNDDVSLVCGAPIPDVVGVRPSSYCPYHARIAYKTPEQHRAEQAERRGFVFTNIT